MFVPKVVLEYLGVSADLVHNLQADLAVARAERDLLKNELISTKISADWLRVKVNSLELEKAGLMEKAFQIRLPVPEIQRESSMINSPFNNMSPFEDMGDAMAEKLGLPTYGK